MNELTHKVAKPHHHIKLSKGFFKDLTLWQQFIHTWNGAGFFLPTSWLDSDSLELHPDASGTHGYGGILGQKWFQGGSETCHQLNTPGISIAWQCIKCFQGNSTCIRLPITINHLKLFFQLLAIQTTNNYDSIMIWAAMTLAFFGFLRLGEMSCNSPYSCTLHLSPGDVTFSPSFQNPEHISARIKISN